MKLICLYLSLFIPHLILATNISGKISESSSFMQNGIFYQDPIRFYYDSNLKNEEFIALVDELGNFNIDIPISKPAPLKFTYGEHSCKMFVTPNSNIYFTFNNSNFIETLTFSADDAAANNYCAALLKRFNPNIIEETLEQNKYDATATAFTSLCNSYADKERNFFNEFTKNNKNLSAAFLTWAKAEIEYQKANRIHSFYFASINKNNDNYTSFAHQFSFSDTKALISNQYLLFLENHLRQLALRHLKAAEYKQNKVPWTYVASNLITTEFTNPEIQQYAYADLLIKLMNAESTDAEPLYQTYSKIATNTELKQIVDDKYNTLSSFFNAKPASNANLVILKNDNPITLKQLIDKYKGKIIYLDFWASWCKPCLAEMPYAVKLQKEFENKNIVFVYFAVSDIEGPWRGNIARFGLGGEHYLLNTALEQEAQKTLLVVDYPRYILIDQTGNIAEMHAKQPSNKNISTDLNNLLNK